MFGYPISQVVAYSGLHFLLSGWVAWLAYSWMSTTLSRILPMGRRAGTSTAWLSFWLSLSFALLAHIFEDYLIGWF